MKFMEWSLNLRMNREKQVDSCVFETIDNYKPEVLFLMESVYDNQSCRKLAQDLADRLGYDVFWDEHKANNNQVMVAIKKGIVDIQKVIYKIPGAANWDAPNFIHIVAEKGGTVYNIVGTRIRIGSVPIPVEWPDVYKDYEEKRRDEEDWKERKKQFEYLNGYISDLSNLICMGDFNNGAIPKDSEDRTWEEMYNEYQKGGKLRRFYSWHYIKYSLGNNFRLYTPGGNNFSWGLKSHNCERGMYGYIKNDHLIVSTNLRKLTEKIEYPKVEYSWDFMKNHDELRQRFFELKQKQKDQGIPDHAILTAEIDI